MILRHFLQYLTAKKTVKKQIRQRHVCMQISLREKRQKLLELHCEWNVSRSTILLRNIHFNKLTTVLFPFSKDYFSLTKELPIIVSICVLIYSKLIKAYQTTLLNVLLQILCLYTYVLKKKRQKMVRTWCKECKTLSCMEYFKEYHTFKVLNLGT